MEGVGNIGTGNLALLVHLSDIDLNRCMVLGRNETVRGRALAGHVEVHNLSLTPTR